MYKYVARRLAMSIPVVILSSLIVFGLMRVMPGDALTALMGESGNVSPKELAKLRRDLGLDLPYYKQYLIWAWQMLSLNPGDSIFTNEPISVALKKSIPVTVELAVLAMILGLAIAVPIGVISATRQDKPSDYAGRVAAITGLSLPDFWLGTLVITFAAIWFRWIPPLGYASLWTDPWTNLQQFLHPPRGAARGLRAHGVGQGPGGAHHHLQARPQERAHPRDHPGRRPVRHAPRGHGDRGNDLCPARDGAAHRGGDPLPRLSDRADQRDAGRRHPRDPQPPRGSDLRLAGSAHPLPVRG